MSKLLQTNKTNYIRSVSVGRKPKSSVRNGKSVTDLYPVCLSQRLKEKPPQELITINYDSCDSQLSQDTATSSITEEMEKDKQEKLPPAVKANKGAN